MWRVVGAAAAACGARPTVGEQRGNLASTAEL